ncbi:MULTISPECIES: PTS sugar transporter subunit IIB [Erwiniaceae]|jgi:PTS system ascorbate-specific IIB component|uniref:PTS system, mannitol-specific EIIB component n=1 Tax=Erwinia billingiae (strain Eb661) TaxID=634500 RepID=D8MWV9_ERWBE|nr:MULTISPECIES: PTS sugar transporter subunit IIB [Erwinia]MBN7122261.1 PTS ascorbate transporter subunit IIB [Erwinia billingiae]MCX0499075.1 PTS ascorbate transporter subunit IIB [Erwinia billingiae]QBR49092.1 PTS sugar transporter subunit IIB [Erwinia sp. QL-Z3]QEW30824.1 PTS ascorbate transporter subunit IIB [Erwinia billingiae]CAX61316.1 PTS system, mannitol-specific EIIB component [Erwinia billingiae Eb661]
MKKLSILAVCGAGLGSSFACEMSIEAALKDLGIEADLSHCDISSATSSRADIIMTGENFRSQFQHYTINATVIYLKRLVDKNEIKTKLEPILKEKGYML